MRMYIDCPPANRMQALRAYALAVACRAVRDVPSVAVDDGEDKTQVFTYVRNSIQWKYLPWVNEHRYILQRANGTER